MKTRRYFVEDGDGNRSYLEEPVTMVGDIPSSRHLFREQVDVSPPRFFAQLLVGLALAALICRVMWWVLESIADGGA